METVMVRRTTALSLNRFIFLLLLFLLLLLLLLLLLFLLFLLLLLLVPSLKMGGLKL